MDDPAIAVTAEDIREDFERKMNSISSAACRVSHLVLTMPGLSALLLFSLLTSVGWSDESNDSAETIQTTTDQASVKSHPLDWAIRYAEARFDFIRDDIEDYTCRLVKRERIDGELQDYQHADVWVRCQQPSQQEEDSSLAVYMEFLAPRRIRGRRLLYVQGQYDDQVLVRKGGSLLSYVRVRIDPNGTAAKRESNYPITDIGMDQIIERLIDQMRQDIRHDPDGTNTKVATFRSAKVKDRTCTHIRVTHPQKADGLTFHRASLYVDDQLHVPIRLVAYDWPVSEKGKPELIEEYNYLKLQLNVGLTDQDFDSEKLGSEEIADEQKTNEESRSISPESRDDSESSSQQVVEKEKTTTPSNQ